MTIREAILTDLSELVELFDAYRVWYRKESDKASAASFLEARIKNNESIIFIAEEKDKQVGFTQILLETETSNTIGNKLYPSAGFHLEENNFYFWTNNQ